MPAKDAIFVKSVEELEFEELFEVPMQVKTMLYIDNEAFDDEKLYEEKYVKAVVVIDEKEYLVYHGFPGDNPAGVLVNCETEEVITTFGEVGFNNKELNDDEVAQRFLKWYDEDSDNISCNMLVVKNNTDESDEESENESGNESGNNLVNGSEDESENESSANSENDSDEESNEEQESDNEKDNEQDSEHGDDDDQNNEIDDE